jgi:amidase
MTKRLWLWTVPLVGFLLAGPVDADTFDVLRYDETTIADIQAAFKAKTLTCRMLVQMYLDRIDAYDKKGPALNAIVVINPDALKVADTLDTKLAQSGPVGPLHCVPLIVKDNYETTDMSTSAGSLSLKGVMSKTDAFQIKKLREAGALMLAKSNMAEFAFDAGAGGESGMFRTSAAARAGR